MCKLSATTEIISLGVCILVGLVVGAIICASNFAETEHWPTDEMEGRTSWATVIVSLPIAFVSGLGVAVGLLDEQTNR